jgi:hypothetical protein
MLPIILQQAPAETTRYMIAGYSIIFTVMILYIVSIFIRLRHIKQDLETLNEMETKEK